MSSYYRLTLNINKPWCQQTFSDLEMLKLLNSLHDESQQVRMAIDFEAVLPNYSNSYTC